MSKKKTRKEKGIFLLMREEAAQNFAEKTIFATMELLFGHVDYAVVLIEQNDNLKNLLSRFEPRVFVFDNELCFILNGNCYASYDLMQRLIFRYPGSWGLLFSGRESLMEMETLDGIEPDDNFPIIFWSPEHNSATDCCPEIFAVEKILKKAFAEKKTSPLK